MPVKASKDEAPFTAYRGAETYVFVCYSHHDTAAVYDDLALPAGAVESGEVAALARLNCFASTPLFSAAR